MAGTALGALAVDVAWSLWRELGMAGAIRIHEGWLVTPEPPILLWDVREMRTTG